MVLFFKDCQFTVDFTSKHFPYERKQEIRRRITDHGGTISYILNKKVCQISLKHCCAAYDGQPEVIRARK